MCKHLEVIIEVSLIPLYSVLYLRLGVSEQDLGCFLGKQFVCGLSVPRHFLNDTNILYITNAICANTWKSELKCRSYLFALY